MHNYDVLIATPGHSMHSDYVKSLTETIAHLNEKNITWKWLTGYSSLVHHAREVLMSGDNTMNGDDRGPLHDKVTYKKMIWIDSDISWKVEDFMKLYDSEHDIVSGAYLLANGDTCVAQNKQFPGGIPKRVVNSMKGTVEIESSGFGFIAVKCGVFEKIQRPWFGHLIQVLKNSRGEDIYDAIGEDVSWCIKAKQAGFKIYFDSSVRVNHLKTIPIDWR